MRERVQDKVRAFVKTSADARPAADKGGAKGDEESKKTANEPFNMRTLETKINEHADAIRKFIADAAPKTPVDAYMCVPGMRRVTPAFAAAISASHAHPQGHACVCIHTHRRT